MGTWLVVAIILAWSVLARLAGRWNRYHIAAVTYALFLVLAPGFGLQYLIILAPLLYVAASPAFGNAYGIAAGLFLLATYWFFYDGGVPFASLLDQRFPIRIAVLGLPAWGLLVYFLFSVSAKRNPNSHESEES